MLIYPGKIGDPIDERVYRSDHVAIQKNELFLSNAQACWKILQCFEAHDVKVFDDCNSDNDPA